MLLSCSQFYRWDGIFWGTCPHFLRQRTQKSDGSIGFEGKHLSSYLYQAGKKVEAIAEQLKKVYPALDAVNVKKLPNGLKQLEVVENKIKTESQHLSDSMLRLIAILAQLQSDRNVVAFDEIENGINTEAVAFLMRTLIEAKQQVIVETHSPLLLNFLDNDLAGESIQYFYKTAEGYTQCKKFFSIPSVAQRTKVLGAGDIFLDTELYRLNEKLNSLIVARAM